VDWTRVIIFSKLNDKLTYFVVSFGTSDATCLCQPNPEQPNRLKVQTRHRIGVRFLVYSLYAWGMPIIIVSIGAILDNVDNLPTEVLHPRFGGRSCWISGTEHSWSSILVHLHFHCFHQIIFPVWLTYMVRLPQRYQ
jgi:hypothetical protein